MEEKEVYFGVFLLIVILLNIAFIANSFEKTTISSKATQAYGTVTAFVISCATRQNLSLIDGWNFPSFYVNMTNDSISKVLSSIEGNYEYILEWNSTSQQFNIWSRQGVKEFKEFSPNKSYFIFLNQPDNISLCGDFYSNYSILLLPGWESPNYIYEYPSNISNKNFYNVSFYYMLKWNDSRQKFLIYSPESLYPDFRQINPGEGFFIRTEGGVLRYIRNSSA